jgi:ketosteroid isomerase-like protein
MIENQAKTTMVFVKESGQWRIAHEHLSSEPVK